MIYKPLVKNTNIYLIKVNKIKLKYFLFYGVVSIFILKMKKEDTIFYYLVKNNMGTWILILVHLFILVVLISTFSFLIEKIQGY
jgi:hypothetical protein